MRIEILPPLVANQIAAGEVIERPASIIKELVENSLDAGSTEITIQLEHGGLKSITVQDNGHGIHPDDLALALQRHGTSKIRKSEDLAEIASLGFRGEALASIAAVAKTEIISQYQGMDLAFKVGCQGSTEPSQVQPASHPQGTSIFIRDLFFNVPARRAFLKSEKTELQHIQKMLGRLILSHFNIKFTLIHQGRILWNFPSATSEILKEQRIQKLFGKDFLAQAIKMELISGDLSLTGWISQIPIEKDFSDCQQLYINQRIVRDRTLLHALKKAYESVLPYQKVNPGFLLFLNMDPSRVDVNVHPTKHEVRFREQRLIHDFVVQSLKRSLVQSKEFSPVDYPVNHFRESVEIAQTRAFYQASSGIKEFDRLNADIHFNALKPPEPFSSLTIFNRFILVKNSDEVKMIDCQKLIFILFDKLLNTPEQNHHLKSPKPLLFPCPVKLNDKKDFDVFTSYMDSFKSNGFVLDIISEYQIIIRQVPASAIPFPIETIFKKLPNLLSQKNQHSFEHLLALAFSHEHKSVTANSDHVSKILDYAEQLAIPFRAYGIFLVEKDLEKFF